MKSAALTALFGALLAWELGAAVAEETPAQAETPEAPSSEEKTTDAKPPVLTAPQEPATSRKPAPGSDITLETAGSNKSVPVEANGETAEGDVRKQLADLQKQMQSLQTTLQSLEARVRKDSETSIEERKKVLDAVDLAQRAVVEMNSDLAKLKDSLKTVTANVDRNSQEIAKIVDQASGPTTVTARRPIDDLADESRKLKRDVIRTMQGRLLLKNSDTASEKTIYVNGTPWRARVGRSFLWVPLGHVSVGVNGKDPELRSDWVLNPTTGVMELTVEF